MLPQTTFSRVVLPMRTLQAHSSAPVVTLATFGTIINVSSSAKMQINGQLNLIEFLRILLIRYKSLVIMSASNKILKTVVNMLPPTLNSSGIIPNTEIYV